MARIRKMQQKCQVNCYSLQLLSWRMFSAAYEVQTVTCPVEVQLWWLMPWRGVWCVGGFGTFHAWLNSFIHFVMYIYYAMSALGPRYQKYLWWKKYMTSMQIVRYSTLLHVFVQSFLLVSSTWPLHFNLLCCTTLPSRVYVITAVTTHSVWYLFQSCFKLGYGILR